MAEEVVNGLKMQVLISKEGQIRVERILSTDPQDFLDTKLQPGQLLAYKPDF